MVSKNDRELFIDLEAVATLAMAKHGLFAPVFDLMNEEEHIEIENKHSFKGIFFPFSFILSPSGKKNEEILKTAVRGEKLSLVCNKKRVGFIKTSGVFKIDPKKRVESFFGTQDVSIEDVGKTLKRLGKFAIWGEYEIEFEELSQSLKEIKDLIKKEKPKKISGMITAARPLHRVHEEVIRRTLEDTDLLILFLAKKYFDDDEISFDIRKKSLEFFTKNFLKTHKVIVVPFEDTYIFSGINQLFLNLLALKNYGCNEFIVGHNHAQLGLHYTEEQARTMFDDIHLEGITIKTFPHKVYCNICATLVDTNVCPHGRHHHISYNSEAMLEMLNAAVLPPSVFIRPEISAMILSQKFPNRFNNLAKIFYNLIPNEGIVEEYSQEDVYLRLMELYKVNF